MNSSDAPVTVPTQEGQVIAGKYRIEKVLGQGGMGVVVAAHHLHLDQKVAIKFVLPEAAANAEARERFSREARAAVKLRSEHVARVLDVGQAENGAPFMVMEFLEGEDLGAMIESRGPLPPGEVVDYVLQACEAVAEAHANGIVHRDLKPRNLFVTTGVDGRPLVKVLDFGISKQSAAPGSASDMSLTKTASIMGSPNYMSPEQLRSSKLVDARTDIWALGVLLYETLTGRVPFEAETVTQLTAMVLQDSPRPLEELRVGVPAGLVKVIYTCLEKDVTKRPQSVAELARALEPFGGRPGVAQRIEQVTLRSRGVPGGASSGKIVGAGTGGTSVAWGETELAQTGRKKGAFVAAAAALFTLAVVGTAVLIGARAMRASGGAGPELEAVPTTRQIELSSPPVTPPPITPAPVAAPPAVSAAPVPTIVMVPPMPSASPAPPPRAPSRHAPAPAAPQPKRSGDDLPSERN